MRSSSYDFVPDIGMRVSLIHEHPSHELEGGDLRPSATECPLPFIYFSASFLELISRLNAGAVLQTISRPGYSKQDGVRHQQKQIIYIYMISFTTSVITRMD